MKMIISILTMIPMFGYAQHKSKTLTTSFLLYTNDVVDFRNNPTQSILSICDAAGKACSPIAESEPFTFDGTKKAFDHTWRIKVLESAIAREQVVHHWSMAGTTLKLAFKSQNSQLNSRLGEISAPLLTWLNHADAAPLTSSSQSIDPDTGILSFSSYSTRLK